MAGGVRPRPDTRRRPSFFRFARRRVLVPAIRRAPSSGEDAPGTEARDNSRPPGGGEATREVPLVHIGPGGEFGYRYAPSKRNRSPRDRAIGAAILIFVFVVSSSVVVGAIWSLAT